MRVISGEYRGRKLKAVPGTNTRPTTDKVKESMFNIIGPYFEGGDALDLFAGTGGLGIEALSRGIERCVFVDKDFKATSTVRENIEALGLKPRAQIYKNDARRALEQLAGRGSTFDLVFLDPPYKLTGMYEETILYMQSSGLLLDDAYIIAEHDAATELPERIGGAIRWRHATYGEIAISFYKWNQASEQTTEPSSDQSSAQSIEEGKNES